MSEVFGQITVEELGCKLAETNADKLQLVDVFPLSEFAQWCGDIDDRLNRDTETLVLCHHGVRSAQMCHWLSDRGFNNVKNIVGGIDAYSILVDRTVPRY
ncbi:MAG: rhodanese-related sulfurtransferase [Oscillatoriales cyanobacterium]|nr:MAG: rhodanese-related sulfurtransferase [Oscillatoriales cyanobacterium]